jgi:hypothetical protein
MSEPLYTELDNGNVLFEDSYARSISSKDYYYVLTPEEIEREARRLENHVGYRYWPIFLYLIDFYQRENEW